MGEKKNILIIDDDLDYTQMVALMLERKGHRTFVAHDLRQVEKHIFFAINQKIPIDLVLLDIMMPEYSGYVVLDYLQVYLYPLPPVVMITALSGLEEHIRAIERGVDGYLTKPITSEQLTETMGKVLVH
jgi:DNA-binding response OmpR family regulator